jgi:putative endonuclease
MLKLRTDRERVCPGGKLKGYNVFMNVWFVYIVRCRDNSLYTGITKDVEKRIETHNSGKGAAYTRARGPVKGVYTETLQDYSSALKREAKIKKLSKAEKELLIKSAPSTNRTGG